MAGRQILVLKVKVRFLPWQRMIRQLIDFILLLCKFKQRRLCHVENLGQGVASYEAGRSIDGLQGCISMAHQQDLVDVRGSFVPEIVRMCVDEHSQEVN